MYRVKGFKFVNSYVLFRNLNKVMKGNVKSVIGRQNQC